MATGRIVGSGKKVQYFVDGKKVSRRRFKQVFPDKPLAGGAPGGHLPGCWPMVSEAMAVHPRQIPEAEASARAKGVPTSFDGEGRPVFNDPGHRKAYCRAYGVHANNGGYGDP
jgi:hypothetical protein